MSERGSRDIAVVGMACIFPGAPDLETYRRNLERGVDAISDVPSGRWDPVFYDPSSDAPDRFYCRRGGFVDDFANFDALGFGIMPIAAQGAEPDQLLALEVSARAMADAGYDNRPFSRERTAVVLGRGNYIGAGMTRLEQHVRTAQQLVECLRTLIPGIQEAQLEAVKAEFQSRLGGYGPDTAIGLVPNLTASRVANRLDLHGPAFTVDGACASSLLAVDIAVRELHSGRADMALAGGVHLSHDVAFWSVFCQLGALSRSEQIRPFDSRADGLLIGEGLGVVVLRRLEDAERDGDRVYAVIKGTGVASDGREASLMQPRVDGQLLALRRAWDAAGVDPATIGLIEAHGTGTVVGDEAELKTLARFFGTTTGVRAGLGSVKSMIGHAMPAAGVAGLIKAALAVHTRQLLPTLHCDEPQAVLRDTRFRIVKETEPWEGRGALRAGVNAFGFGGINAHVVLESHGPIRHPSRVRVVRPERPEQILLLAAETPDELIRLLDAGVASGGDGPCRLALVDPSPERRAKAREAVRKGKTRRGRDGLWFTQRGLIAAGGQVAFMFPGVEAVFEPRVADVARHFDRPLPLDARATGLERQGVGVISVGRLLHHALERAGVQPDVICGHSIGEWSGMIAAGIIPSGELERFMETLVPGSLEVPGVVFVAIGASIERVTPLLEGLSGVRLSHDNCPHQTICCGPEGEVDILVERMREARVLGQKLPFRSGFHSPVFEPYLQPHRDGLAELRIESGDVPLWSATICEPYPTDPDAIRALSLRHLVEPVRFRELTEALYRRGVRVFVQIGTGSLVGFVADTLRSHDHLAISANVAQRSGMNQLRRVVAALFVEGLDVEFGALAEPDRAPRSALRLQLGVPLVQIETPLDGIRPPPAKAPADPVLAGFDAVMRGVNDAQDQVLRAFEQRKRAERRGPAEKTRTIKLGVREQPYLLDHSLIPQPPDWPVVLDKYPVVPMTMSIRLMMEAAEDLLPGRRAIQVRSVRAYKWVAVEPPIEAVIEARELEPGVVKVAIQGYCEATVVTSPHYPAAPAPEPTTLTDPAPPAITATELYSERWMFHGPAYQGVTRLDVMGADGILGHLSALPAKGALLDAAGQLFGYWVMASTDRDRLAMPIKIETMDLYGPEPRPGVPVECCVWLRRLGAREVRADLQLTVGGRLWARIIGWEDWRFDTDDRLWAVMHRAEHHLFASIEPEGFAFVDDGDRSSAARDYLSRRFLGAPEREIFEALPRQRQVSWLYGRIVAKDVVRHWLAARGAGGLFPVEVLVEPDADGRPRVRVHDRPDLDLRVSIAHKGATAVAAVAEGREVGIDLEAVEARPRSFVDASFVASELALKPDEMDTDEWHTRLWCAKEAVGKARGTGLQGRPKDLVVAELDGARLRIDDVWVTTRRHRDWIIGCTEVA